MRGTALGYISLPSFWIASALNVTVGICNHVMPCFKHCVSFLQTSLDMAVPVCRLTKQLSVPRDLLEGLLINNAQSRYNALACLLASYILTLCSHGRGAGFET